MRNSDYRRDRRPRWPHFDSRGPEYYYDDNPWDGRGSGWSGVWHGRSERPQYFNESDIYEDEFDDRDRDHGRRYDRDWPDDDFYDQRRYPAYVDNDRNSGWRPSDQRFGRQEHFPEDRRDHHYGSNIHDRNRNRGRYSGNDRHW